MPWSAVILLAMARTIFHADLDAFYASVEQLDKPELRGRPVVVGGPPESRGVVAAASYEARRFGVRSAMPMSRALRICPDAVRVSPRFDRYGELSREVMAIFRSLTPLVEPMSLDEAFLDVTERVRHQGAEGLARFLKHRVRTETQLTVSIGAGSNKSVAKVASDIGKPDGLVVVAAGEEASFLAPLPVRTLWGIGPKTDKRLAQAGVRTVADLAALDAAAAARLLGSGAAFFQDMARGVDDREVVTEYERKSVGAETTFARDLPDGVELRGALNAIAAEVAERMRHEGMRSRTVALKLRYANFHTITRQTTAEAPVAEAAEIAALASRLLDSVEPGDAQFRLLGIQCSKLTPVKEARQEELWAEPHESGEAERG